MRRRRRGRPFFLARFGGVLVVVLSLSVYGGLTLFSRIAGGGSGTLPPVQAVWPVILLLSGVVFVLMMRRVGRPLGHVVAAAERVASGDFAVRVAEHGPPWLRSVAAAFNSMTARLEQQRRQRRDLMADIAHELRTPLSVVQGRLEGMLDGVYPRDERQVEQVLEQTRLLGRLVDDLRTLAHSESGTLALQKEQTDLGVLLEETRTSFGPEAELRSVVLGARVPADIPLIEIDPLRIREVFTNLLSNAVRHTPAGGTVSIEAEVLPDSVAVRVSDNGAGIPPEELRHIFDRFYKGSVSSGSGLGLTIARNLVSAHAGTIIAESQLRVGTTFTVTLPFTPKPSR
jgi:two-component system OmpR family sensor kinase/two-component system sensor histidine kinase BaeS